MKKYFYSIVLVLFVFLLTACSNQDAVTSKNKEQVENSGKTSKDIKDGLMVTIDYSYNSSDKTINAKAEVTNLTDNDITIKPNGCTSGPLLSLQYGEDTERADGNIRCIKEADPIIIKPKQVIQIKKTFTLPKVEAAIANKKIFLIVEANNGSVKKEVNIQN